MNALNIVSLYPYSITSTYFINFFIDMNLSNLVKLFNIIELYIFF